MSTLRAVVAAVALGIALTGVALAPRAARAELPAESTERVDPFWPIDAGVPEAGTRPREIVYYPWSCACRATGSPASPAGGGPLVALAALLVLLAAALRRARVARTPCAQGALGQRATLPCARTPARS